MSKLIVQQQVVVFSCALIIILCTNTNAQANDCSSVVNNILSFKNNLENPSPAGTQQCCEALSNIYAVAAATTDSDQVVGRCLEQLGPAFLPSKARQLPGICNLPALSSLVNSIAPETETGSSKFKFSPKTPKPAPTKPPKAPKAPGFQFPRYRSRSPIQVPIPAFPSPGLLPPANPIPTPPLLDPGLILPPPQPIIPPLTPALLPPPPPPQPIIPPLTPALLPPPNTIPTPPLDPGLLPPTTPEVPASPGRGLIMRSTHIN